jgi:beta-glucanase (GH16 family)
MENLGNPTVVAFHNHFSGDYPEPGSLSNTWYHGGFSAFTYLNGPDYSAGFHTFGLNWEPTRLTWYVDGVARFSTTENLPPGSLSPGKMFVIANLAIGRPGSYPGPPDASTVFPQSLNIQYIRVYQKVTSRVYMQLHG